MRQHMLRFEFAFRLFGGLNNIRIGRHRVFFQHKLATQCLLVVIKVRLDTVLQFVDIMQQEIVKLQIFVYDLFNSGLPEK